MRALSPAHRLRQFPHRGREQLLREGYHPLPPGTHEAAIQYWFSALQKTLAQCWFYVGTASKTLAQHKTSIGSMSVFYLGARIWIIPRVFRTLCVTSAFWCGLNRPPPFLACSDFDSFCSSSTR